MPPEPTIAFSIAWLARMLRTRFDGRARSLGLTRAQWRMIAAISHAEGATQSEIASRLEINSVTAGRIIDRIEATGWVERRPDPADRRANRLYVKSAAPILESLGALAADEERLAMQGMNSDEQATLARLLQRMIANLTLATPPDVADASEEALLETCA